MLLLKNGVEKRAEGTLKNRPRRWPLRLRQWLSAATAEAEAAEAATAATVAAAVVAAGESGKKDCEEKRADGTLRDRPRRSSAVDRYSRSSPPPRSSPERRRPVIVDVSIQTSGLRGIIEEG